MKCRNLNYVFDAWEVPENISDYIFGTSFSVTEDMPSWLEDINNIYAQDDNLVINDLPITPGAIIVWNTKLRDIQDIFFDKEKFEEAYYCPFNEKGSDYDL